MKFRNIIASALIICILLTTITPAFDEKAKAAEDVDITKSEIIKSAAEYLISSKNSDNSIGYSGLINDTAEAVSVLERFIDADKFNSD